MNHIRKSRAAYACVRLRNSRVIALPLQSPSTTRSALLRCGSGIDSFDLGTMAIRLGCGKLNDEAIVHGL